MLPHAPGGSVGQPQLLVQDWPLTRRGDEELAYLALYATARTTNRELMAQLSRDPARRN
ncbi:hypothetical protein ACFWXO_16720 [Kitasatospora sp. NPDC059088]|uniref:hypothetical protein n=1 Tax=Kitasatospora sp. NPDC059088 TaxID=3346722 RepID=UPI0036B4D620